jgi:hypothetical protein
MKRKEFNGTPHFGSLPRGERRIERMLPHPDPLPRSGEGREGEMILMSKIKGELGNGRVMAGL